MPDASPVISPAFAADLSALARALDRPDFGRWVLKAVAHACVLRNFGVFVVTDPARPEPVMSVFAGDLGEYRIRRNARDSTSQPGYPARFAALLAAARTDGGPFARETPDATDPRWPIYRRSGLLEHIACAQVGRGAVHVINYYRSIRDGPIGAEEEAALRCVLPLVNDLIMVRHKLVGADRFQTRLRRRRVAGLRERGRPGFATLSEREAEVLDGLGEGRGLAAVALDLGVSENTARTLRARAYRKLGIGSAGELFSLLLADAESR